MTVAQLAAAVQAGNMTLKKSTSILVSVLHADDLVNCAGNLKVSTCPD